MVEEMTRMANTAVHLAQEENRRNGIPNVYVINGKIIWQLPDGTITDVDPTPDLPQTTGKAKEGAFTPTKKDSNP